MATRRPLAEYSNEELTLLNRIMARYAEAVNRHGQLTTVLHVASASGDFEAFATARNALPEAKEACRRYRAALDVIRDELSVRMVVRQVAR